MLLKGYVLFEDVLSVDLYKNLNSFLKNF